MYRSRSSGGKHAGLAAVDDGPLARRDALGRRATTTDPRTGDNLAHYDALGRVDYVQDAAGNRTRPARPTRR